jgi:hypothetical protein
MRSLIFFTMLALCFTGVSQKCGKVGTIGPGGMPFIRGVVKDTKGAPVPKATVTVVNLDTNVTKTAESDINGNYIIPAVNVGRYRISVSAANFSGPNDSEVKVGAGQKVVRNFTLSRP